MEGRRHNVGAVVPLPFFGLALWRAWMNLTFVAPSEAIPFLQATSHQFFDLVMLAAFLMGIAGAKFVSPLTTQRWALAACPALMMPLSAASFASAAGFQVDSLAVPLTVMASIGSTLMIVLWSERYAGMSPFRVLVGLTGSYALGSVFVFVMNGFYPSYLAGFTALLPLASIACLLKTRSAGYPVGALVRVGRKTIPWRLVAIMVLYSFSIGFSGIQLTGYSDTSAGPIQFLITAPLFAALVLLTDRVSVIALQKLPPMLMALGFVAVLLSPLLGAPFAGPLISASYLLYYFFVDTSLCDIAKRFGISAVWLFSIEEAASMGSKLAGDALRTALCIEPLGASGAASPYIMALLALAAVAGALLLFEDRGLKAQWGIRFLEAGALSPHFERETLTAQWVRDTALAHRLSPREDEVLERLVHGQSMQAIASELVIAEGTAKSHASHVYEKLGVRNRRELASIAEEAITRVSGD